MHHFKVKIFQNYLGMAPQTLHLPPQNGMEASPKYTILGLIFQNVPGVAHQTPPPKLPPQNGMEEPQKCTILRLKIQNFSDPPPTLLKMVWKCP